MNKIILICTLVLFHQVSFAQSKINRSKSKADFQVINLGVKVKGSIRGMYGEFNLNETDPTSSFVKAYLDVRAIRTGIKLRDEHLMEERFLHKEKYPKMSFVSTEITKDGNAFVATGNLTIRDVTKAEEISFINNNGTYQGTFSIDRKEYNVDNDDLLTKGIGDEITISFTVVPE